jgi:hypothetical protein
VTPEASHWPRDVLGAIVVGFVLGIGHGACRAPYAWYMRMAIARRCPAQGNRLNGFSRGARGARHFQPRMHSDVVVGFAGDCLNPPFVMAGIRQPIMNHRRSSEAENPFFCQSAWVEDRGKRIPASGDCPVCPRSSHPSGPVRAIGMHPFPPSAGLQFLGGDEVCQMILMHYQHA